VSDLFARAVDTLVRSAQEWTDVAGPHARTVASRVEDGAYRADPDLLVGDAAKSVALAARGSARLAASFLDAANIIADPPTGLRRSRIFSTLGPVTHPRSLELDDDMETGDGRRLRKSDIEIHPRVLPAGARRFQLMTRATGLSGLPYLGEVKVREQGPEGAELPTLKVRV
jgi:hypothetical protein